MDWIETLLWFIAAILLLRLLLKAILISNDIEATYLVALLLGLDIHCVPIQGGTADTSSTDTPNDLDRPFVPLDNNTTELNPNRVYIPDNAVLVVDGHNIVHDMLNHRNKDGEKQQHTRDAFLDKIRYVSDLFTKLFSTQKIYLVFKNPPTHIEQHYIKQHGKPFIDILTDISVEYPTIQYHVATDSNADYTPDTSTNQKHSAKGRDDLLINWLGRGNYMISCDNFRDFDEFRDIPAFEYYIIQNRKKESHQIEPTRLYEAADKPNVGHHFKFKFTTPSFLEASHMVPGGIYKDDSDKYTTIYFTYLD